MEKRSIKIPPNITHDRKNGKRKTGWQILLNQLAVTSFIKSAMSMEKVRMQIVLIRERNTVLKMTCPISGRANKYRKFSNPTQGEPK